MIHKPSITRDRPHKSLSGLEAYKAMLRRSGRVVELEMVGCEGEEKRQHLKRLIAVHRKVYGGKAILVPEYSHFYTNAFS